MADDNVVFLDSIKQVNTLLFVDDEDAILRSLQRLFVPLGYRVLTANSGEQGLQLLKDNEVDVIISDMRMPKMNGATFLKQAAAQWPAVKRLLLTGYADVESAISAVNDGKIDYYLTKPWKDNQIEVAVQQAIESKRLKEQNKRLEQTIHQQNQNLKTLNESLEQKVMLRTAELNQANEKLRDAYHSSIQVLSTLVDRHDNKHRGHCQQISFIAKRMAELFGLDDDTVQDIYFSCLLHNIGKIGMDRDLLAKSFVELTPAESLSYKKHPLLAEAALMAFQSLNPIAQILKYHRERYDGSGYPYHLVGDDIPLGASIVAAVVDYDQLQQGLLVSAQLTGQEALKYLQSNKAKYYAADIIDCFTEAVMSLPEQQPGLKEIKLSANNLQEGMILTQDLYANSGILLLPKEKILTQEHIEKLKNIDNLLVCIRAS